MKEYRIKVQDIHDNSRYTIENKSLEIIREVDLGDLQDYKIIETVDASNNIRLYKQFYYNNYIEELSLTDIVNSYTSNGTSICDIIDSEIMVLHNKGIEYESSKEIILKKNEEDKIELRFFKEEKERIISGFIEEDEKRQNRKFTEQEKQQKRNIIQSAIDSRMSGIEDLLKLEDNIKSTTEKIKNFRVKYPETHKLEDIKKIEEKLKTIEQQKKEEFEQEIYNIRENIKNSSISDEEKINLIAKLDLKVKQAKEIINDYSKKSRQKYQLEIELHEFTTTNNNNKKEELNKKIIELDDSLKDIKNKNTSFINRFSCFSDNNYIQLYIQKQKNPIISEEEQIEILKNTKKKIEDSIDAMLLFNTVENMKKNDMDDSLLKKLERYNNLSRELIKLDNEMNKYGNVYNIGYKLTKTENKIMDKLNEKYDQLYNQRLKLETKNPELIKISLYGRENELSFSMCENLKVYYSIEEKIKKHERTIADRNKIENIMKFNNNNRNAIEQNNFEKNDDEVINSSLKKARLIEKKNSSFIRKGINTVKNSKLVQKIKQSKFIKGEFPQTVIEAIKENKIKIKKFRSQYNSAIDEFEEMRKGK